MIDNERRIFEISKSETRIACAGHVFLVDREGMSNFDRGPSIDASYQVSDNLAKPFQRRRFLEIDQSEIRIA